MCANKILYVTFNSADTTYGGAYLTNQILDSLSSSEINIDVYRIPRFSNVKITTISNLIQLVWGLIRGIDIRIVLSIRELKKRDLHDYQLIILDSTMLGGCYSLISKMKNKKVVVIAHNNETRYIWNKVRLGSWANMALLFSTWLSERYISKNCFKILTFTERNFDYFKKLGARVERLYVPIEKEITNIESPQFDFLFIGSDNLYNRIALTEALTFMTENPQYSMLIAGGISHNFESFGRVVSFGKFDEPKNLYNMAKFSLNLMRLGEGIKIKTIESLAYGTPVIGYSEAFEGISEDYFNNGCYIVDKKEEINDIVNGSTKHTLNEVSSVHLKDYFTDMLRRVCYES